MDNFENIQLYRTNVLLGGNMKYDLVLDDNGEDLIVKDFHITHITGHKAFKYDDTKYLLNETHQKNILDFYNANMDNFYKDHVDVKLSSVWPIIYDKYNTVKTYDDNWFMGMRRPKLYEKYQKQFEFLVPVWLEKIDELIFDVSLYTGDNLISTKSLTLNPEPNKYLPEYHNDFCKYIYDYFKHIGIHQTLINATDIENNEKTTIYSDGYGSNDVFDVNFTDYTAYVHGLNLFTGNTETRFLNNKCDELMEREIPFPDFNDKITSSFRDNSFIAKQLFNFNLCFNIQDIASPQFKKLLLYKDVNVKVNVKSRYKDENGKVFMKKLAHKDFYTNYEFIPKKKIKKLKLTDDKKIVFEQDEKPSSNVLDFLQEYKCVDYMHYNKITQQNHMWSLVDDPTYIFNLYGGFAGDISTSGTTVEHMHNQGLAFDPTYPAYDEYLNNEYWCNCLVIDEQYIDLKFLNKYINNISELKSICSNVKLIHNDILFENDRDLYVLFILIDCVDLNDYIDNNVYHLFYGKKDENLNLWTLKIGDINIFLTNKKENLCFQKIKETFKNTTPLNCKLPKCVPLNLSVSHILSNKTDKTTEIEYILNNDYNFYVNRYDGKIKPTFIDVNDDKYQNYIFYKKINGINEKINTNIPPLYPSINHYYINRETLNYNTKLIKQIDGEINYNETGHDLEYCWFNNNNYTSLPQSIKCDLYPSGFSTPYTICLGYLSTLFPNKDINTYIEIPSQHDSNSILKVSSKIVNILNLYNIDVKYVKPQYEKELLENDKVLYKDTLTGEYLDDESKKEYKYYEINLKLK